jgi:hypothetical protein
MFNEAGATTAELEALNLKEPDVPGLIVIEAGITVTPLNVSGVTVMFPAKPFWPAADTWTVCADPPWTRAMLEGDKEIVKLGFDPPPPLPPPLFPPPPQAERKQETNKKTNRARRSFRSIYVPLQFELCRELYRDLHFSCPGSLAREEAVARPQSRKRKAGSPRSGRKLGLSGVANLDLP